jgi:hypothetical protein
MKLNFSRLPLLLSLNLNLVQKRNKNSHERQLEK